MSNVPSTEARPHAGQPYAIPINTVTASSWQHISSQPIIRQPAPITSTDASDCQTRNNIKDVQKPEDIPVIYIDIPGNVEQIPTQQNNVEPSQQQFRRKSAGTVAVCMELPETHQRNINRSDDTGFIEETIFYDPFDDRRIGVRNEGSNRIEESTERRTRLALPSYCESPVDDGLRLSPIPVPEYPDPPPAYTELDITRESEPRTQVVVPDQPPHMVMNSNRKVIMCPYCGRRVLTRTVRESGVLTHILGIIFMFACFPALICIYCTDCCKYRNHYCPRCDQFIAYEVPVLCQDIVYTKM